MITAACEGCGNAIAVRDEAAAQRTRCPKCGGTLATSVPTPAGDDHPRRAARRDPDEPPPRAVPVQKRRSRPPEDLPDEEPERAPEPPPLFSRLVAGAAKGLVLPFVFLFVIVIEFGINALLGINNSSRNSVMYAFFPRDEGLKMIFVALLAFVLLVVGAVGGHAAAGVKGGIAGGAVGYLLGSGGGGIFLELIRRDRARRA